MKKLLCLLLSLLLLTTALAACGNDQEPQEPAEGTTTTTTAPTVTVTPDVSDPTDSQWEGDPTDTTGGDLPQDWDDTTTESWDDTTTDGIDLPTVTDPTATAKPGTPNVTTKPGTPTVTTKPHSPIVTTKPTNPGSKTTKPTAVSTKPTTGPTQPSKPAEVDGYKVMTVAQARNAAKGVKVYVTGVVARITYANGMVPSGVMLVDDTGSIYIYDRNVAGACSIGNTITVKADKTYWILETEQSNAEKFGYQGCNQLENCILVANDKGNKNFSKKAIESTTVKEILDTHVTTDITSEIFKVNALIKKAPGQGFVNYYINDLDGTTGTYVYTQCNGSDFSWLDKFDGKICTVYLTALNAKSTASDCLWRFLPVAVYDEGFDPKTVNVAEHAVKYYGIPQFLTTYTGDPALKLIDTVDSDLLGFKGARLMYSSSDKKVATVSGNVLHCLSSGKVTITVTGSYKGKSYAGKVTLKVTVSQQEENYPTVAEAIAAKVGDKVTVRGIVGPSLVNKSGFYLIDKSGVIAVETTAAVLETLEIGYDVVLEATRGLNTKDKDYGQTCLKDATVKLNKYGNHAYSTAAFKGDISVQDFYNLPVTTDVTTHVYTMKATVKLEETAYYTNIMLTDGSTDVRLYCSSANQYSWLKAYAGQQVTLEIAPCNWNSKSYYTGCVLAVVNQDGSKIYNTLNFN